ncbi:Flagellar glycoprotein-like protein [Leptomonas seymouri]|uniref:Flagellar glycoprotein-like protein n=1 Tax=Leptomonas seymouri TaxID=5684 RepID=A0A0N0P5I6_LEPSE|nr:Flagellar glycoprotein-like protein [Leptomonas seymouri]|eukprot:KPI86509.1 Flagellar glycoprotein-like protein [Leptomonas seymouri]
MLPRCTVVAPSRHRWMLLGVFAVLYLLLVSPTAAVAQATAVSITNSDYQFDGTNYYYTLFTNHLASSTFSDGESNVGRYGAVGFGGAFDATGVVFSDMTLGSRIRKITNTGKLYTIAGSISETGCTSGSASVARFGGTLSSTYVNAIIAASGGYYIADSQCSSLRFISSTTRITTNISTFVASQTSRPAALAKTPHVGSERSNIFVTDPANNNIRFLTLNTPVTIIDGTIQTGDNIFQPIGIAILPNIHRIVATNLGKDFIYLDYTEDNSGQTQWSTLSKSTTTSSLVTSWDGLHVLYISENNIMSMPVNTAEANAGNAVPTVTFSFTPLLTSAGGADYPETMLLFAPRSKDSYFILTTHRYLIVSATPINDSSSDPGPDPGPDPNPSSSSTPTSSSGPVPPSPPGGEHACDSICRAAIASSSVMACAGLVLIALMIIAPANFISAIIMVPII